MGDKLEDAQNRARTGVPLVPGSDEARNPREAGAQAEEIGYPLLLKGGGGRRARHQAVWNGGEIENTFRLAAAEARGPSATTSLYERYVGTPGIRGADPRRPAWQSNHLGERDCSLQRRHQRLSRKRPPTPCRPRCAPRFATPRRPGAKHSLNESAGTSSSSTTMTRRITILNDTRIQVEHPVTE